MTAPRGCTIVYKNENGMGGDRVKEVPIESWWEETQKKYRKVSGFHTNIDVSPHTNPPHKKKKRSQKPPHTPKQPRRNKFFSFDWEMIFFMVAFRKGK